VSGLLNSAASLTVPSRYESLSLVLLEAWNHAPARRGTLAFRRCSAGRRANGRPY